MNENYAVQALNLTKYYGETLGVEDLDLDIKEGEIFGFLGPNGAGKTTTIRCLMDFIRPTSGSVSILGMDAQRESRKIKEHVGYLASEVRLYSKLTGEHLIRYEEGFRGKCPFAEDLVKRLGAEVDRRICDLSKGNKQLIAIETGRELLRDLHAAKNLKIGLEVDTDPPAGFETETQYVLQPIPFSVLRLTQHTWWS